MILFALLALTTACNNSGVLDPDDLNQSIDCESATPNTAVRLFVANEEGEVITPTSVQFSHNDEEFFDATCVNDDCSEWISGYADRPGKYDVAVQLEEPLADEPWCYFWAQEQFEVEVSPGACSVITEERSITLAVHVICSKIKPGSQ